MLAPAVIHLFKAHCPDLLEHSRPAHGPPPFQRSTLNRTFHVLPRPDIPYVTNTVRLFACAQRAFRITLNPHEQPFPPRRQRPRRRLASLRAPAPPRRPAASAAPRAHITYPFQLE